MNQGLTESGLLAIPHHLELLKFNSTIITLSSWYIGENTEKDIEAVLLKPHICFNVPTSNTNPLNGRYSQFLKVKQLAYIHIADHMTYTEKPMDDPVLEYQLPTFQNTAVRVPKYTTRIFLFFLLSWMVSIMNTCGEIAKLGLETGVSSKS